MTKEGQARTSTTSPTLWTTTALARAYEKAARKAFRNIISSRPDVFGDSFTTSCGEIHAYGLAEGKELPTDGEQIKARASTAAHLVITLAEHRKSLTAAVGSVMVTATRRSRDRVTGDIADIVADVEEAQAIGVTAKIKPYAADITADALADIVETARHTAAQARANHNDEEADGVITLLNDLRRTVWEATEGRPVVRHVDADAILTAANALALALEDIKQRTHTHHEPPT